MGLGPWTSITEAEYAEMEAELAKLRAALEKIIAIEEGADVPAPCHIRAAAVVAREALK